MRTFSRTARSAVVSLVLLALLAGCGGRDKPDGGSRAGSEPTKAATSAKPPSDDGQYQVVRIKAYGLSYTVPKEWSVVGADQKLTADGPVTRELAARIGKTPAELTELVNKYAQSLAITDEPAHGFSENVVAAGLRGARALDSDFRQQVAAFGGTLISLTHPQTPVGKITRMQYQISAKTVSANGVLLAIPVGQDLVVLTVSASTAKDAVTRADQIQASLAEL